MFCLPSLRLSLRRGPKKGLLKVVKMLVVRILGGMRWEQHSGYPRGVQAQWAFNQQLHQGTGVQLGQ